MNCTRCNFPLVPEARFCPNCGLPVSSGHPQSEGGNIAQANQQGMGGAQAVLPSSWQVQQSTPAQPHYPPKTYQPTVAVSANAGSLPNAGFMVSPELRMRRQNRLLKVFIIALAVLLVVVLLLVGGWLFLLRPYLHGVAQNEVDGVFSSATNLINPLAVAVVAASHRPVIITEKDANNFIAMNSSQSDPVQQVHLSITPGGVRLDFQTYGLT